MKKEPRKLIELLCPFCYHWMRVDKNDKIYCPHCNTGNWMEFL